MLEDIAIVTRIFWKLRGRNPRPGFEEKSGGGKYLLIGKGFALDDYELFLKKLARSKSLLYLGDNAGEIVSDKILIEELLDNFNLTILYVVRGFPILNDVTMEDAHFVGLDKVVKVVSNGFDAPGTLLDKCSEEFLKHYKSSDLILSKGQGNYESLSRENRHIFFLLQVKCPIIARDIHCSVGDLVLKARSNHALSHE